MITKYANGRKTIFKNRGREIATLQEKELFVKSVRDEGELFAFMSRNMEECSWRLKMSATNFAQYVMKEGECPQRA